MQGNIKTWTIVGVLTLVLLFGGAYAFTSSATGPWGRGTGGMMGGVMMGPAQNSGPGMGLRHQGASGGMGPGQMMGCPGSGWGYGQQAQGPVNSIDQAIQIARNYLSALNNPDLTLAEIMQFSNNFYVEVRERSTGIGAFELLIDPLSGTIYPEPGPNMMWNTKYGHMAGWTASQPTAKMPITPAQARDYAQQYLDIYLPGTTVADDVDVFYGYYTIHVLQNGQIYGMLSVNGYTGQVWYHNWHGQFMGMRELG